MGSDLKKKDCYTNLMVTPNAQMRVTAHNSIGRNQFTGNQLQQSGLASPVRSDQRDTRIKIDSKLEILVDYWLKTQNNVMSYPINK